MTSIIEDNLLPSCMCVISNIRTDSFPEYHEALIKYMIQAGVLVKMIQEISVTLTPQ